MASNPTGTTRGATAVTTGPPKSAKRWLIPLLLLLLLLAALAAFILLKGNSNTEDAKKDVKVTDCKAATGDGKPTASGRITNHSSRTSTYVLKLSFKDAQGNDVSKGVTNVGKVDPDKSADWSMTGVTAAKGKVTCELTSVSRTRVPG